MTNWIPIVEYSLKTGISVSTIRRKIKTKALKHRTENGKYLILDENTDYKIAGTKPYIPEQNMHDLVYSWEKAMNSIQELNKKLVAEKDRVIITQETLIRQLRGQIDELKMLVSVLEKNSIR